MSRACSDCTFWYVIRGEPDGLGECRRYAPRPASAAETASHMRLWMQTADEEGIVEHPEDQPPSQRTAVWVVTVGEDWCGEYTRVSR